LHKKKIKNIYFFLESMIYNKRNNHPFFLKKGFFMNALRKIFLSLTIVSTCALVTSMVAKPRCGCGSGARPTAPAPRPATPPQTKRAPTQTPEHKQAPATKATNNR
jgi:hypothetical protein